MIVLTLPYPVSANRYWTAVHTKQRTMMVPSKEAKVYDGDVYRDRLIESLDGYDLEDEKKAEVVKELKSMDFDDEHWVLGRISDFEHDGFKFQDVWEIDMTAYSYHFIWCCYAIAWGIQQYEAKKGLPL